MLRCGALKFEMCNAWDWEGFQFPGYGGVHKTFKEVGITGESRTFKEVGLNNKKTLVRRGSPNQGSWKMRRYP